jgi:hypothetical protein
MLSQLETMGYPLVGARVQRVYVGRAEGREVALIKIRAFSGIADASAAETIHVVLAAGMGAGVVDAGDRERLRDLLRATPSPAQAQWRATVDGGRLTAVGTRGLAFVREGRPGCARAEGDRELTLHEQPEALGEEADCDALIERGRRIFDDLARTGRTARRDALRRGLTKAMARLDRRLEAVRGDLARMKDATAVAEVARLFVAQAAQAPRGITKLEAVDWSRGEARPIELAINPAGHAKEQIEALFKRARRLKQGLPIMQARLVDGEKARASLAALAETLESRIDTDLAALEAQARAAAPRDFRLESQATGPARPARPQGHGAARPPYRTFLGQSGARVLVGRGASHNDALTFRVAKPHDLWLHAKSRAGAHVVVPLNKGQSCAADLLVEAAHLAAHFSDAREDGIVEVEYTPRRYLRKPRGAAPGLVVVDREKVIVLRRKDDVLRKLLEREVEG